MWTYRQSTGQILRDGIYVSHGYSGFGEGKNNPTAEAAAGVGPIPRGRYTIGERFDSEAHGPACLRLQPDSGNVMYGRDGFLIHGDSESHPGAASRGCIILPRAVRLEIAASADRVLEVVC